MKILNRLARAKYRIIETLEAGIILTGAEIKSLRLGRADLSRSFARIQNGQVYLKNLFIPPYHGQVPDLDPRHDRKLLLKKNQIRAYYGRLNKAGMTLVPLSIYFTRNMAKVELALAASKAKYDHRREIKVREELRSTERDLRKLGV